MNRLLRFVLILVAPWVLAPVTAGPALADPIGGVIVIPGTGTNLDEIRLRTSAGCPAQANAYYASMRGHGFAPDGQIVTANTKAGLSHSHGFDVWVGLIMRDYATKNRTTLTGRYDITVYCIDHITLRSYGDFTGALAFTSPTTYEAIGASKPVGPLPPPQDAGSDGFAIDPNAASLPTNKPPEPGAQGRNVGQPIPQISPGQAPGADSQVQSQAGQLASQRDHVTVLGASWLILIGTVLGAALIVGFLTRQIRRRRSS